MSAPRLPNQPGELIDRHKLIRFTFDGKAVEAYEGDTVGIGALRRRPAHVLAKLQVPPPAR